MKLYLYVSKDEYELPMAVADTPSKLAQKIGVSTHAVYNGISRFRANKHSKGQYRVVEVDEDD